MSVTWSSIAPAGTLLLGYVVASMQDMIKDRRVFKHERDLRAEERREAVQASRDEYEIQHLKQMAAALSDLTESLVTLGLHTFTNRPAESESMRAFVARTQVVILLGKAMTTCRSGSARRRPPSATRWLPVIRRTGRR